MGPPQFASGVFGFAVLAFWISIFVFWVVVGWRAMRALEGIDQSLRERQPR